MGYQNMTRQEFEDLRRQIGDEDLSDLVATFGTRVDGQPVTSPLQSAMEEPTPPMGTSMPSTGGLSQATAQPTETLGPLQARVAAYDTNAKAQAEDRFARQQEMIQTMYGGPTTSETLFALSRALLAPRQFSGFGSTVGKLSGAFGDMEQQRRASEQKRGEAQLRLQSSYEDRTAGIEKDNLSNQIELAKIGARYAETERKANEPRYDVVGDQFKLRPGTGGNLGMLTPEQALLASQDPRNKGKSFYTTDGQFRIMN